MTGVWSESLWDGLTTGNMAFQGSMSPSPDVQRAALGRCPSRLGEGQQGSQCGSTPGSQPLALSCPAGQHLVLWVVPEGTDLSPRIRSTHPPIRLSV